MTWCDFGISTFTHDRMDTYALNDDVISQLK